MEIESFFSRRLAGRFPFADPRTARADAEMDVETIREFYQVFDRYAKPARAFLAPLMDRKNPNPGYDVDSRVNREREVGGRQIIDWTLSIGEQRVRFRDAKRQARWQVGDPVRVVMRWAKDYPYVPTGDGTEGVTADDRTVTWDYSSGRAACTSASS